MSNPKNKAVIGTFVVGAVVLAVVGVLILGGGEFFKKKLNFIMFFEKSVKGLKVGAPVVFHGVHIGAVKEVAVRANTKDWTFKIPVIVEIDPSTYRDPDLKTDQKKTIPFMIEKGLRATLQLQSMVTGMLQVNLDFKPDSKPRLAGGDLPYLEIPTTSSGIEKFTKEIKELPLKEIFDNLSETLSSIKDFVENPELKESVHNLNQTILEIKKVVQHVDVDVVGPLKPTIQHADQLVLDIDAQIKPLFNKADKAIDDIDKLVVDVDKEIKPLAKKIGGTADSFKATSDAIRPAIKTIDKAFANIESMTRKGSTERKELNETLKHLSGAARSIKDWADYLERHPEALIRGKGGSKKRR
jgi:phospholipid/cholesterol/gamma-HCH transport system substrate-binding protein